MDLYGDFRRKNFFGSLAGTVTEISPELVAAAWLTVDHEFSDPRFVVPSSLNPGISGHFSVTFGPEEAIARRGGGWLPAQETRNTVPQANSPPCSVVPYRVLPDTSRLQRGLAPS